MSAPIFCMECGTKLSPCQFSFFDAQTGERATGVICRNCHPCDHNWVPLPWYVRAFIYDFRCTKCDKKTVGDSW